MTSLTDNLYDGNDRKAILSLMEDKSCQHLISEAMGKKILESDQIILEDPLAQLLCMVSLAPFADSEEECVLVAAVIYWGRNQPDVFPMISEHSGQELADRCLISLSFYKGAMMRKFDRHGAPAPDFYRRIGIGTYKNIGRDDISAHFKQWESFIPEMLVG
jgi:hypothetical protein